MEGGGAVGGTVTAPTVVGAVAGAATVAAGVAVTAHGVSTAKTALSNMLAKPGSGKGSVPPGERDPKRVYSKKDKEKMLDKQEGNCANCGEPKTLEEVEGHHEVRHADGGKTDEPNGKAVCTDCHKELHKPDKKEK